MTLSKSLYTRAIQCPKSLWLKKYKPEVLTSPDASAKARFETGNIVGDLACELFPDGREIPFDAHDFKSMARLTQAYLDEGVENIYEATFIHDDIVVMVDILHQTPEGLELYEVKSSTDVKPIYLHDVSIQLYVLEALGFRVEACHVVHINSGYVREEALVKRCQATFLFLHVKKTMSFGARLLRCKAFHIEIFSKHLNNEE